MHYVAMTVISQWTIRNERERERERGGSPNFWYNSVQHSFGKSFNFVCSFDDVRFASWLCNEDICQLVSGIICTMYRQGICTKSVFF